jgi:type II secretory pathway pseudopilin PulG
MRQRKQSERGFALLVIFLMAGAVALMLYRQLPRAAFERERDKEQLLMDRGEQYIRAVQLYYTANNRYPQRIEDLENTNDKRYLRRRYVDPYTGKDEWRIIHTNGQFLTDSLVEKPPDPANSQTQNASNTNQQQQGVQVNSAVLQRPSDNTLPGSQNFQGQTPGGLQALPQNNVQPGQVQYPGQPVQPLVPGQAGFGQPGGLPQGFPLPGGVQAGGAPNGQQFVPQFPGQQFPGQPPPPGVQVNRGLVDGQPNQQQFTPQFPGQQFPGQPQAPGANQQFTPQFPGQQFPGQLPPGVQNPQLAGQPAPVRVPGPQFPGQPPLPGQPQLPGQPPLPGGQNLTNQPFTPQFPGQQFPGQPPPPGYTLQNGQLVPVVPGSVNTVGVATNQGVIQGTPGAPATANNAALNLIGQLLTTPRQPPVGIGAPQNNALSGGIAGVASTHAGPSIKVYKERSKYEEWEFVYTPPAGAAAGGQGGVGGPGRPGPNGNPGPDGNPGPNGTPGPNGQPFPGPNGMPFPNRTIVPNGGPGPAGPGAIPQGGVGRAGGR